MVNTVLATITAKAFKDFSDQIEKGASPQSVAQKALKESFRVIFNGNGYDAASQEMLTKNGLWRIDSGIDAIKRFTEPKNVNLFEEMKVLTAEECGARRSVMLAHYTGQVEIEVNCMIDMINQHILPSCRATEVGPIKELEGCVETLQKALHGIHAEGDEVAKANKARTLRLETMISVREVCDAAEAVVPAEAWSLATYKELLFLDQHE
jgi:glutamine synthetase